ncbi:hypothetical protein HBI56_026600 [Parastagonospora nodorum]|nr:hypothetical protein HBI10_020010 [Parastagonospora nodorum]KAH4015263.1 hypothetical protein HBI13_160640 [Parastagonospora nodorum]KAH4075120.1 hypothetical protein HBH50_034170 [Parastagonospora nodorum]KAH4097179.1 hypothetical protein HBH48_043040 [Parastagonospora nodorum]KAH4100761.1 hypothetical protein HBH46_150080 [Parastagonospora nodorum]
MPPFLAFSALLLDLPLFASGRCGMTGLWKSAAFTRCMIAYGRMNGVFLGGFVFYLLVMVGRIYCLVL